MASMRELAMDLLSRAGSGPVLQPTNVFGQDPDLPIGYGEGEISPLDAAAMSTMLVPGVGDVTGLAADVDMYMRDPESRNIPNYLLTAAGALPFLPAASQVRKGIKAYHGTAYDMPPSQRYLDKQTGKRYVAELDNPLHQRIVSDTDRYEPIGEPSELGLFDANRIGTGEGQQSYGRGLYFAESEDVSKRYRDQLTPRDIDGRMYKVNIDADPDELIEWDELIDEQPKKVMDKLKSADWWPYAEEGIYDIAGARGENPTGADLVRWLEQDGQEYAAEALEDLGVKGIKYADAFTRHKSKDKRSMNYVIFDDRLITIAKKYGIAIPAAAAMLARMTGEDTSQSYQEET